MQRQHGNLAAAQHALGVGQGGQNGFGLRPSRVKALDKRQPHVAQDLELIGGFDAFGHQLGAKGFGQTAQGLHGLQFVAVPVDFAHKVFVDLDVFGAQLGPQAQAGAPVAKIIERQRPAVAPQALDYAQDGVDFGDLLVLGQFEHQRRER